ncbi:hypothetical protein NX862_10725 [Rhodobacter sp. KR11]|uniref:hypothetical protein n=1 Tax=Rhodobacter sp. KR11 TaxID=2974588 RepID=UPI0022226818|nr:hypothetical protein [Rhodobacter sp. KR11]MCW1919232.1 hypothetical protein [Rhodobacter sp. KR11]
MELILGWQLLILATLVIARLFSTTALSIVAILWTLWTLAMLYFGPLVLLQLATIWIPVGLMLPKETVAEAEPVALSLKAERATPAAGLAAFVSVIESGAEAVEAAMQEAKAKVSFSAQFQDQRSHVEATFRVARQSADIERRLKGSLRFRQIYSEVLARMEEASASETERSPWPRLVERQTPIRLPNNSAIRSWAFDELAAYRKEFVAAVKAVTEDPLLRAEVLKLAGPEFLTWLEAEIVAVTPFLARN